MQICVFIFSLAWWYSISPCEVVRIIALLWFYYHFSSSLVWPCVIFCEYVMLLCPSSSKCVSSLLSVCVCVNDWTVDWFEPTDCCPRIGQSEERSLFEAPADCSPPLHQFTHIQLGLMSSLPSFCVCVTQWILYTCEQVKCLVPQ